MFGLELPQRGPLESLSQLARRPFPAPEPIKWFQEGATPQQRRSTGYGVARPGGRKVMDQNATSRALWGPNLGYVKLTEGAPNHSARLVV